jgi:hypothetical protein
MSANVKHSSVHVEHYTPVDIVERARRVLGDIDLDPASSHEANEVVKAKMVYSKPGSARLPQDGLEQVWFGRTFLNPPGGSLRKAERGTRSRACRWWIKLCDEWEAGNVTSAIFIGFSVELIQVAQSANALCPLEFPCCFPKRRIAFDAMRDGKRVSGTMPTHANFIVLLPSRYFNPGPRITSFVSEFHDLGFISGGGDSDVRRVDLSMRGIALSEKVGT